MAEFIGFVNKLYIYTQGWKLKIDQLMFQLPTLDWLKRDVAYIYSAQWLLSKPKHRPFVRLQNATTTNFKSKTNSEHIVTALGSGAHAETFWTLFVELQETFWYLKLQFLILCLIFCVLFEFISFI
jgi:hypothetical protein